MTAAKTKISPKKNVAKKAAAKKPAAKRIAAKKSVARDAASKSETRTQAAKSRIGSSGKNSTKPASKPSSKKPLQKEQPTSPAPKPLTVSKSAPAPEPKRTMTLSSQPTKDPRAIRIVDTPGITEQFANQILDVFLVNGHTVSMTFGAKRTVRESTFGNQETVIAVNSRLTLDIAAAEALLKALGAVLRIAKNPALNLPKVTLN